MTQLTTVRYGNMRQRGLFEVQSQDDVHAGDACVIKSPRGYELGTVLATPIEDNGSGCGEGACGSCATTQGSVLRLATREDREAFDEVERAGTRKEVLFTRQRVREHGLSMKIAGAEYLLRKEKLVIHFSAPQRLDFRDLVKDLAKEFKTRIEMKQVGARDEARLVGDMASCGRELCCRSFLHDLQPVSMRMAKTQKKTLDPTKISGQCGKLKCCLRYEDEVYTELQKTLPKRGGWVRLEDGLAKVVNTDVLLQKLVVEKVGSRREVVHLSELLETGLRPPTAEEIAAARSRPTPTRGGPASARSTSEPPPPKRVSPLRLPTTRPAPASDAEVSPAAESRSESPEESPAAAEDSRGPEGGRDRAGGTSGRSGAGTDRGRRKSRGSERQEGKESSRESARGRGRQGDKDRSEGSERDQKDERDSSSVPGTGRKGRRSSGRGSRARPDGAGQDPAPKPSREPSGPENGSPSPPRDSGGPGDSGERSEGRRRRRRRRRQ